MKFSLSIGVLALRAEGRGALLPGEQARIAELADILRHTLRRCDVIARVEPSELAVILVGERTGAHSAGARISEVRRCEPPYDECRLVAFFPAGGARSLLPL